MTSNRDNALPPELQQVFVQIDFMLQEQGESDEIQALFYPHSSSYFTSSFYSVDYNQKQLVSLYVFFLCKSRYQNDSPQDSFISLISKLYARYLPKLKKATTPAQNEEKTRENNDLQKKVYENREEKNDLNQEVNLEAGTAVKNGFSTNAVVTSNKGQGIQERSVESINARLERFKNPRPPKRVESKRPINRQPGTSEAEVTEATVGLLPITLYEGEASLLEEIRRKWLSYFQAQGISKLECLVVLHFLYTDLTISSVSSAIAVKYLFLKEVSAYGTETVILTSTVDAIVVDMAKLPKKFFRQPQWGELTALFQKLSAQDVSNKPIVLIGMSGEQIQHLVAFPKESTGFALDIAYDLHTSNPNLAKSILLFCGIDENIIVNLLRFSSLLNIHADIFLALVALARENPQDFLTKTTEYIQLANIVYQYSLEFFVAGNANKTNFMANRGFEMNQSAPAYFFITETPDRLIALYFTAVVYETIGNNEAFLMLRNYLCLMLCSHRSLSVDSICHGVSSFQKLKQQKDEMTKVMERNDKINTILSFFNQRGDHAEGNNVSINSFLI